MKNLEGIVFNSRDRFTNSGMNLKNIMYAKFKTELEYIFISHLIHDTILRIFRYKEGHEFISKIISEINKKYPNWKKNQYFKKKPLKYKIVSYLAFHKKFKILNLLLKKGGKCEKS
jgi:hypothetical protein